MALLAPAAAALSVAAAAGAPLPGWVLPAALGAGLGLLTGVPAWRAAHRDRIALVGTVSHDLRTPLAQIRLITETLLLDRAEDADTRARWLAAVAREAQVLDDRIANLLLVAHADGLRGAPHEPGDLGALVEDVGACYAPMVAGHGMTLRVDAEPGLVATADPRLLRLALAALIDNACRYGPPGQTVRLSARRVKGRACLAVEDQGAGIAPADRERIWRPFVRLREDGQGAGLGLTVVARVAEAHGGGARVVPTAAGANVCLELPLP